MKKFFPFLVFIFIGLVSSQASGIKQSPALIIKTFDGKIFNLEKNRGKIVIVNFWASWCVDCKKEMLILEEIYHEYKSRGLEIIGISIDREKDRDKAMTLANSLKYKNAMIQDAKKNDFDFPDAVPVSYVINGDGKIKAVIIFDEKPITKKDFDELLRPLF